MLNLFDSHAFHMGGDEVNMNCYKSSPEIQEYFKNVNLLEVSNQDIIELWVKFQTRAADLVQKFKKLPIILWTSALTSHKNVTKYLPPSEYIIQFWDKLHSKSLTNLINKGYKVIVSNYDALYLDCGYANWVTNGTNWCSPYKGEFKYIF